MREEPATMKKNGILIIAVYSHIEAYPPSLNAIALLSERFDHIYVLHRNVLRSAWEYPSNVILISFGDYVHAEEIYKLSFIKKIRFYIGFGKALRKLIDDYKPSLFLVYDPIAFAIANLFVSNRKIQQLTFWYHNHDVLNENELSRTSLMWWMRKAELHYFQRADYFTLPTKQRLVYFPIEKLRNPAVILPNYPSLKLFSRGKNVSKNSEILRLVFQGQIGASNAIDIFINILPFQVLSRNIELHLAGPVSESYKKQLLELSDLLNVSSQIIFYGRLPYSQLPAVTSACHIGIAIYRGNKTMVKTMSTASNKIFEYASAGLPVIINKREDMQIEFASNKWIKFISLETPELLAALTDLVDHYDHYSQQAKFDFNNSLNFENHFVPFVNSINFKKQIPLNLNKFHK